MKQMVGLLWNSFKGAKQTCSAGITDDCFTSKFYLFVMTTDCVCSSSAASYALMIISSSVPEFSCLKFHVESKNVREVERLTAAILKRFQGKYNYSNWIHIVISCAVFAEPVE